ncbi:MAG: cytotoxic translational repressor of toxin-antitoxin stability system [Deltaproteobacteria bacterium RIFOXYD12_FULL_50_9]|nr:MAG: cytotoxic translational repressor of toxin-antitoxin stability system [Deltaproteobacteria bacterium RIFOXYD12_FULL_50_9]
MKQWQVNLTRAARKQRELLPKGIKEQLVFLIRNMEEYGPVRGDWPNYGKLKPKQHHCHLKKGRPTYVAVWEERDREIRLIEVTYVGTHEKAPY